VTRSYPATYPVWRSGGAFSLLSSVSVVKLLTIVGTRFLRPDAVPVTSSHWWKIMHKYWRENTVRHTGKRTYMELEPIEIIRGYAMRSMSVMKRNDINIRTLSGRVFTLMVTPGINGEGKSRWHNRGSRWIMAVWRTCIIMFVRLTSRTCCWSPWMPNERITNHSLSARNRLLSGICQCYTHSRSSKHRNTHTHTHTHHLSTSVRNAMRVAQNNGSFGYCEKGKGSRFI